MAKKKVKPIPVTPPSGENADPNGHVIDHASKLIKSQSKSLKDELGGEIDKKLKQKIMNQQNEIQALRQSIELLKNDNEEVGKIFPMFWY
jgi:hypothetical protein